MSVIMLNIKTTELSSKIPSAFIKLGVFGGDRDQTNNYMRIPAEDTIKRECPGL